MDARCRIEMLGGLRVRQGQRELTRFHTRKTGALLAYLAYHCERVHPREVLATLLWPESEPAAGRGSLSMALSSLRRQLEPPGVPRGAVIRADRFSVQLNPAAVTTDVADFEAAVESAQAAGSDTGRAQRLVEAVELYRGELLPGHYQDWIITEQRRLAELYFRAVRSLTQYFERTGEPERAVDYARRAVAIEPLREEGHQDLIRLLAATEQPSAALRQFQELERILKDELGAPPSAATRELAREVERRAVAGEPAAAPLPPAPEQPPLPTGAVTFLLTDIEDARILQVRSGEGFQQAVESHNAILRRAFERHGGREVREAAGAFTVAFAGPSDALACAVAGQRALAAQAWPEDVGAVRVRMALDITEVKPRKGQAPGSLLRRGTGLLLAAHGGQTLCTEAAAGLLRRRLRSGVQLADLGLYRLRSLEDAERVFEVKHPGRARDTFPPPNAAPAYSSNLPLQLNAFFGREDELAQLEELLLVEGVRLATLTGPGGSGKSRLAVEAARHLAEAFRDAVWHVPLQDLSDPRLIADATRHALRLPRSPRADALEQVVEALSRQRSLLVLDNFEQLVDEGASVVRTLLERVPTLACLVTSRRRLGLTGEREFLVPPLPTPSADDSPEGLMRWASVELFVDRAQAARPDFQVTNTNARTVRELCTRLEGIPLAIELAAARAQVLTPAQMVAQLEHRFDFLVSRHRDAERRHRTLRAALAWSYRLLSPELQRFFARLSVFRGGWTPEAAEAVCEEPRALDSVAQLRMWSLILAEESRNAAGGMRFRMLETLREHACEQLSPQEQAALRRKHAEWCLALAEGIAPKLAGSEQAVCLDQLEAEHDNLRAALEWYSTVEGGAEPGLRLAAALRRFWDTRGYLGEGRRHLAQALAGTGAGGRTGSRAKALDAAAGLAKSQGDHAQARALFGETLAIWRELGDRHAIAGALHNLGSALFSQGEYTTARALFQEALALERELGDRVGEASILNSLGVLAIQQGDYATARSLLQDSLAIRRDLGDTRTVATTLGNLANVAGVQGEYAVARPLVEESLAIARQLDDRRGIARFLSNLAIVTHHLGDRAAARTLLEESLQVQREVGDKDSAAISLTNLGVMTSAQGDYAASRLFLEEALAINREIGNRPSVAFDLCTLGAVAQQQGDHAAARRLHQESLRIRRALGDKRGVAECLAGLAAVCHSQGQSERAARLFAAGDALREAIGAPLAPHQRGGIEREVAAVRAAMGAEAFAAASGAGRAMSWEEAVACALEADGTQ